MGQRCFQSASRRLQHHDEAHRHLTSLSDCTQSSSTTTTNLLKISTGLPEGHHCYRYQGRQGPRSLVKGPPPPRPPAPKTGQKNLSQLSDDIAMILLVIFTSKKETTNIHPDFGKNDSSVESPCGTAQAR